MEAEQANLERQITGIASLKEPVRRALYRYVVEQGKSVSRDEAAEAVGVSRSLTAFHLDKLVEEGLLETEFRRLSGRSGPGAGRPSKLYKRSIHQFEVNLPPRSYELAARLFARTLSTDASASAITALGDVARDFGAALGAEAREISGPEAGAEQRLAAAEAVLAAYGYEPFLSPDGTIRLRNCPFHALARDYTGLVCGMNLSLMEGVLQGLASEGVEAVLDPQPGMCCVAFRQRS